MGFMNVITWLESPLVVSRGLCCTCQVPHPLSLQPGSYVILGQVIVSCPKHSQHTYNEAFASAVPLVSAVPRRSPEPRHAPNSRAEPSRTPPRVLKPDYTLEEAGEPVPSGVSSPSDLEHSSGRRSRTESNPPRTNSHKTTESDMGETTLGP